MSGDELEEIRKMLDTTRTSVEHHSKAFTNVKRQVDYINKDATTALHNISRDDQDIQKMMQESIMSESTKVVIREENDEEDETIDPDTNNDGIQMGNEKHIDVPL